MNKDQFDNLKQFIANTVLQTEVRLTQRIDGLDVRIDGLDRRINGLDERLSTLERAVADGFAGVGEVIEQLNQHLDDRDKEVDGCFAQLEGACFLSGKRRQARIKSSQVMHAGSQGWGLPNASKLHPSL